MCLCGVRQCEMIYHIFLSTDHGGQIVDNNHHHQTTRRCNRWYLANIDDASPGLWNISDTPLAFGVWCVDSLFKGGPWDEWADSSPNTYSYVIPLNHCVKREECTDCVQGWDGEKWQLDGPMNSQAGSNKESTHLSFTPPSLCLVHG